MRNKLYKSILLFACLFISTTVINAATGSGSGALVNIRNTSIGGRSSKIAGFYNTTYTDTTKSYEEIFNKTYKTDQNGWNAMENTLWSNYKCKVTKNSTTKKPYCNCTLDSKNSCKVNAYCADDEGIDCYYRAIITGWKSTCQTKSGTAGTYIHHYTITNSTGSSSSNAYCIQPSKQWPGSSSQTSLNYTLNRTVDVRKCKSIGDRSIGYSCGLAEIFYQAKKGTMSKLSDENQYYNVIGAALRMWVVYWYKFTNYRNMAGIEQESVCGEAGAGAECVTGNEYASKPVYYNTVNAVLMGYTGSSCKNVSKKYGNGSNHGILCWNNNDSKEYVTDIIKLFNYVRLHQNDKIQDNRFGAVDDSFDIKTYIKEKQKLETAKNAQTKWNMTIDVRVDENVKKQIIAKCNPKDESGCDKKLIEVIDAYGRSIGYCKGNDVNEGNSCFKINFNDPDYTVSGKDSYLFTFKVYNYKVCVLTNREGEVGLYLTKPGITFHLKGGALGFATVRQYIHSSSPAGRQVMMTYIDDYKKFDGAEVNISGKALEYHFPFDLSDISCDPSDAQNCDHNNNCSSLDKKTDIKNKNKNSSNVSDTCNESKDSFDYKSIEDPQMACIINNCDKSATEEYDVTNKVSANPAFCKVYCRDEVRFYIPSPTSVFAGMQFRFDLGKSLIQYGAIDKQVKDDKKLTAVVVRYKQCTSVFNQAAYSNLAGNAIDKEKAKNYCLMNTDLQKKLTDPDSSGFSYDSNKEPIKLTATYEEGNKVEIKSEYKKTKESLTYCKNNCYKVNKTKDEESCEANLKNFTTSRPSIGSNDVIYSTLIIKVQNDYYIKNQFSYEPITGKVSMNNRKTKIPKYSYPVSIETESGKYNINYKFTNISKDSSTGYNTFNFGCYYNVYNTTKKYNCDYTSNGKIDLSKCSNACFEIDNEGNTVVDKNCINWKSKNKYGLGITYRNVSLKNLFPVARNSRNNWYYNEEVNNPFAMKNGIIVNSKKKKIKVGALIEKTQEIGNNIYNKDHLESSYYLSTETIKKIKKYNKDNGSTYLNDTANNCIKISRVSGGTYYRCGSTFLDELKNNYNAKVGGN